MLEVAVTVVVCFLLSLIFFLWRDKKTAEKEVKGLQRQVDRLNAVNNNSQALLKNQELSDAYNQGLYAGRETDALWRKFLQQYDTKGQVSVLMNGEYQERAEK